jgi:beta-lactamase superfamily II metal-dependent hydrolase
MSPFMNRLLFILPFLLLAACSPILPLEDPFLDPIEASETEIRPLRIEVLDVGQGDATLILGPDRTTMLIDAGSSGEGILSVLPTLEALNVDRLDWIVATHYDADHIGGIGEVVKGLDQTLGTDDDFLPAQAVIDRGKGTDKTTATYEDYALLAGPYRREAKPGMVFPLGDGAQAEVVVVNGSYEDGRVIALEPEEENEASIGLLITYGNFRYFTAGDLTGGGAPGGFETKDLETAAGALIGDIDVLHAGHHGSESSSNAAILSAAKPEAVVISVGADNDYGHPASSTLLRLEAAGAEIYRTDILGSLEIETDGRAYTVTSVRNK